MRHSGYGSKMMIISVLFIFLLLSSVSAQSAEISGYVYDLSFQQVENVLITIDTEPRQQYVSRDGSYSFSVPHGNYTISAEKDDLYAREEVVVKDGGGYRLDLILFPEFEDDVIEPIDDDIFDDDIFGDIEEEEDSQGLLLYAILVLSATSLGILVALRKKISRSFKRMRRKKRKENHTGHSSAQDSDKDENAEEERYDNSNGIEDHKKRVLDILDKEGITTQKDVRKAIPLSEAKVSLILSEMEEEGMIRRFKKGRSNVIRKLKD